MLTQDHKYLKDEGVVHRPGDGTVITQPGEQMEIRVRSEETGGAWALVEGTMAPGTSGPPLHINTGEDEVFYILEGALLVQLGERQVTLTPGCIGYVPKGTVHTFCNPYAAPVRMLGFLSPGGFERFFAENATVLASTPPGAPPDVAALMAVSRKFGGVFVGPPMTVPDPPLPVPQAQGRAAA